MTDLDNTELLHYLETWRAIYFSKRPEDHLSQSFADWLKQRPYATLVNWTIDDLKRLL